MVTITMIENVVLLMHLVRLMKVTVTRILNAEETLSVGETIVLYFTIFHLQQIAVKPCTSVMVSSMIESAVQLKLLVQSMKVTVTLTLNAKETLSVGKTIVLHLFHLEQIAVRSHLIAQS